jgi:hypothetical protein
VRRVKARGQRDLVAVVGHAAAVNAGEFISATGWWVSDREHGLQLKATHVTTTQPTTIEGIEKYLGSGMIRGIGPVYARAVIRRSARRCLTSSSSTLTWVRGHRPPAAVTANRTGTSSQP